MNDLCSCQSCVHCLTFSNLQVSFYYGFAVTWQCLLQHNADAKSRYGLLKHIFTYTHTRKADKAREPSDRFVSVRKRLKALEAVVGLIRNSLYDDPQSAELQEEMDKLRAKFRQVHLLPVTAVMTV